MTEFLCFKCGVRFSKDEGGLCSQCHQFFCQDHLFEVKEAGSAVFLCEEDKGQRKGKRVNNPALMIRRWLGGHSQTHNR